MRHRLAGRKLNRSRPHYKRLLQNLACHLFQHHRIVTTVAKAKELRPYAEKLITLAKEKNIPNVRRAVAALGNNRQAKDVARHLFDDIAPTMKDRPGGYTRILRLSNRRLGDGGEQAIIELVNYEPAAQEEE
ncbi:MAG TPA: 50S ribosomal protein L17 [Planctomycetes bacterium]|nr:50S ribosomal protein L17 [Planctomycetota bacterium]